MVELSEGGYTHDEHGTITGFSSDGFIITYKDDGVRVTRSGQEAIDIYIPGFSGMGLDMNDLSTRHAYVRITAVGSTANIPNIEDIYRNLRESPAPSFSLECRAAVGNGDQSYVPLFVNDANEILSGNVTHYVDPSNYIVTNVTNENHLLSNGLVVRQLYEQDGEYYIASLGVGNGPLGYVNTMASGWLWGLNAEFIGEKTLAEQSDASAADDCFGLKDIPLSLPDWLEDATDILASVPGLQPAQRGGGDPLVLDINGDGQINLTSVQNGVYYDFWNDGFAEKTGWVAGGDGMLVLDKDNDGLIEGYSEMVATPQPFSFMIGQDFAALTREEHGFAQLAKLDSNFDGVIDAKDPNYAKLRVWIDQNQDGVSQKGELKTLAGLGIKSIDYGNAELDSFVGINNGGFVRRIEGNIITHSSTYTLKNGTTREIVDAWLDHDLMNSHSNESFTLNAKTLFLPTLKGFGNMVDLHVAMSENATLLAQVEDFALARDFTELFTDFQAVRAEVRAILFEWADVAQGAPSGEQVGYSGVFAHMPEYFFMKKYMGLDTQTVGMWFDERGFAPIAKDGIEAVLGSFDAVLDNLTTQLVFQSGGTSLFAPGATYNPILGEVSGELRLSQTAIAQLQAAATTSADKEGFWHNVAEIIGSSIGLADLTASERGWLSTAVAQSTSNALTWTKVLATFADNIVAPTAYSAALSGTRWDDTITAYDPQKLGLTLSGGNGDDSLNGSAGNDRLIGGAGNDYLYGHYGSDTFVYESGHDVFQKTSPYYATETNTIQFGAGIGLSDISVQIFARDSHPLSSQTIIAVNGRGTITLLEDGYTQSSIVDQFKLLKFADGSSVPFSSLAVDYLGSEKSEQIYSSAWIGVSKLYGFAGDDVLYGDGNGPHTEILIGGEGNDTLYGGRGDDTYLYEAGDDVVVEFGNEGYDWLSFKAGVTAADISIEHFFSAGSPSFDLLVKVRGEGSITLKNQVSGQNLEALAFSDGTSINLVGIDTGHDVTGTSGNDVLNGRDTSSHYLQDHLIGGNGNDVLNGRRGDDILEGGNGDDRYIVGDGFDYIYADTGGNDKIVFDATYDLAKFSYGALGTNVGWLDILYDGAAKVRIMNQFAGHAIEAISVTGKGSIDLTSLVHNQTGQQSSDYMSGISSGGSQNNRMFGLGGDDTLIAGDGNDFIEGGFGSDRLIGGSGDDTYNYIGNALEGQDRIIDEWGTDQIVFGGGLALSNMSLQRLENSHLKILFGSVQYLTVESQFDFKPIETLRFSSGAVFNLAVYKNVIGTDANDTLTGLDNALLLDDVIYGRSGNDTLKGVAGNDTLFGEYGNDTLDGGIGNDRLEGGYGDDKYVYAAGGGLDTIYDNAGTRDSIQLGVGYDSANVSLVRSGDLDLTIMSGKTVLLKILGQFGDYSSIETLKFANGTEIDLLDVSYLAKGTANRDYLYGINAGGGADRMYGLAGDDWMSASAGNDYMSGGDGSDFLQSGLGNDSLYGDSGNDELKSDEGNDLLVGGTGNDKLQGGYGDDTYEFAKGFGLDTVQYDYGGIDTLTLGSGISIDAISIVDGVGQETRIIVKAGIDEIALSSQQGTDVTRTIEKLAFADGFEADLLNYKNWVWGTSAGQTTNGSAAADTILGRGGNDLINGNQGNDALHGGAGNDTLKGGDGNDLVHGGVGNDILYGDTGNDTIFGDNGLDSLFGGTGADRFVFLKETAFKNVDNINDFALADRDQIDISDLLSGYTASQPITDFVKIVTNGGNSSLMLDANGGADNFVAFATILGVVGLENEQSLVSSGYLLIA